MAKRTNAPSPASGFRALAMSLIASAEFVSTTLPVEKTAAAQAIMMKAPMRLVRNAPRPTSSREPVRSSGPSLLSATYDWMNAWPHGVIVVPTVATTVSQYSGLSESLGMTSDDAARPQSGCAMSADMK